ncbi:MAG: hypothetical protein QXG65_03745 [Thermoplasmata archaeon]
MTPPLIAPDSRIPEETLRQIYGEHRAELAELRERLKAPGAPVRFPLRLEQVDSLLSELIVVLDREAGAADRAARIRAVNLSYDAMVLGIEIVKLSLDAPIVPRRRAPPGGPTAAP